MRCFRLSTPLRGYLPDESGRVRRRRRLRRTCRRLQIYVSRELEEIQVEGGSQEHTREQQMLEIRGRPRSQRRALQGVVVSTQSLGKTQAGGELQ